MSDSSANVIAALVAERLGLYAKRKLIDEEINELDKTIKALQDVTGVDIKPLGMTRIVVQGSVGKGAIPLLKKKGLNDAVIKKETVDTKKVEEYIKNGKLTEEEIAKFRGKGKDYYKTSVDKGDEDGNS